VRASSGISRGRILARNDIYGQPLAAGRDSQMMADLLIVMPTDYRGRGSIPYCTAKKVMVVGEFTSKSRSSKAAASCVIDGIRRSLCRDG